MPTTEEFRLLRSLVEWRRANGWGFTRAGRDDMWWFRKGVWRVFVYSEEYNGQEYMVLRVDDRVAMAAVTVSWPRSVEQAVDMLVAADVLPVRFSSAYRAGRESAYTEDEWRVCSGPANKQLPEEFQFPYVFAEEIGTAEEAAEELARARWHWRSEESWIEHRRKGATDWSRVDAQL